MTDTEINPIMLSCHVDHVLPQAVFDAWVKPEIMKQWLSFNPDNEVTQIETDLRPGGKFLILEFEKNKGAYFNFFGEYIEVEEPMVLAFKLFNSDAFPEETTVTVHIFPTLNGTEVKLTQSESSNDQLEANWVNVLQKLKLMLEAAQEEQEAG